MGAFHLKLTKRQVLLLATLLLIISLSVLAYRERLQDYPMVVYHETRIVGTTWKA